jgi:hypothetical protein
MPQSVFDFVQRCVQKLVSHTYDTLHLCLPLFIEVGHCGKSYRKMGSHSGFKQFEQQINFAIAMGVLGAGEICRRSAKVKNRGRVIAVLKGETHAF